MQRHLPATLEKLVYQALVHAGASAHQARSTARALIAAEAQGLASHGLSRVRMYRQHLQHGRVNGQAQPHLVAEHDAAVLIDADDGFSFPACELAVHQAIQRARRTGLAMGAVTNSHHFGAAAHHLMPVANAGMVGLALGNSPAAMPVAGGKRALLGTNPIAAVFPLRNAAPLIVDMSLSEVARGKLMVAAQKGQPIPLGWALDAQGKPTTDPARGLEGAMLPVGGTKGAMLAMVVELLVTSLTGARYGAEADSFFQAKGNRPRLGHVFIVINPQALAGQACYEERTAALVQAALADPNVRLPGQRRQATAKQSISLGINVDCQMWEYLTSVSQGVDA
ncbi:MAG: Ldh family oxidoreductase [Pseudomonadota bacterium]|nr:Ldh family oxidoreductase [Pseudomonadota bacterium]